MQKKSRKLELHSQNNGSLKIAFFLYKGVGMIRAEIGLKNSQIINETYSFRCFLIL